MKLYLWINGNSESDFAGYSDSNCILGYHSGGLVITANNKKEAMGIASKVKNYGDEFSKDPIEIDLTKSGIVIFADGQC